MKWRPPPPEDTPAEPSEVVHVDRALVTAFERGHLLTADGPFRWHQGAVHDAVGDIVRASQRHWNGDPQDPIAADHPHVRVPRLARRLRGTWHYAGHWSTHFGHFLLETLPNTWPGQVPGAPAEGLVAHRPVRGAPSPDDLLPSSFPPWQRDLLDLVGFGQGRVVVVADSAVKVERLVVATRPVVLKRRAGPEAVALWDRIADQVPAGAASRVYLSRSRFHAAPQGTGRVRSDAARDTWLDETFAAHGFEIVHPELLPVADQIALVRDAEIVAGQAGSAMHLTAFAGPATRTLVVGDRRSRRRPPEAQVMIDAARGHHTGFVPYRRTDEVAGFLTGL